MFEWQQCTHMDGTPASDQWAGDGKGWNLNVCPQPDGTWDWYARHDMGAYYWGSAPTEEAAKKAAENASQPINPITLIGFWYWPLIF